MLNPRKPLRPNPPPLTRGAPIVGTDPTTPAAAGSQADRQAARQAAIDEAKRKSQAKYNAGGGFNTPESDVGDLASLQQQHDRERAAAEHQLEASKAQALQTTAAKSGAAGFGLSGASAALQGDVGRASDRNSVLTMADLRGKQNDENFAELQREVALNDAEEADDTDFNKDGFINGVKVGGKIGDHNPDNNPATTPQGQHQQSRAAVDAARAGMSGDGGDLSPFTGDVSNAEDLKAAGITFDGDDARHESLNGIDYVVVRGSDGKLYKFALPPGTVKKQGVGLGYAEGKKALQDLGLI